MIYMLQAFHKRDEQYFNQVEKFYGERAVMKYMEQQYGTYVCNNGYDWMLEKDYQAQRLNGNLFAFEQVNIIPYM